jgi:hypothetical protein
MSSDIDDPKFGAVPFYSVANTDERNAIPMTLRVPGLLCYTSSNRTTWRLLPGPWSMSDLDWTSFP